MPYDNFPIPEIVFGIKRKNNKTFVPSHSCGWIIGFGGDIPCDNPTYGPWYCPKCGGLLETKEV